MRIIQALKRYPVRDVLGIAVMWVDLACMDVRLKILPYRFNRRLLQADAPSDPPLPDGKNSGRILRLARLVDKAAEHPLWFNMSCLRRALVLRSRLRALGLPARLVYGARKDSATDRFVAHAWITVGEVCIYSNAPEEAFSVFKSQAWKSPK